MKFIGCTNFLKLLEAVAKFFEREIKISSAHIFGWHLTVLKVARLA
jgi:hypothetical protein